MMKTKLLATVLALALLLTTGTFVAYGDASKSPAEATGTLTVLAPSVGSQLTAVSEVNDKFMEAYPGIKVEFASLGGDYETTMKVRMASNTLPDVFATHGWAKLRYAEYLMDLKDEPWAQSIDPAIRSLVTDGDKVLALPLDSYRTGYVYNATLLEQFGLQVPTTLDEMNQVLEAIHEKGGGKITGLYIGGGDNWMFGAFINTFATPMTASTATTDGQALLDGTYDWNNFTLLPETLLGYYQKGYLNVDCLTATFADATAAIANNQAVFVAMGPEMVTGAQEINPDFKGGIMPIPAAIEGDFACFQGGENTSWAIWKDTPNAENAKLYLDFAAQPENVQIICSATLSPSGLTNVDVAIGEMDEYWQRYATNPVYPMWDRTYMPNGMWDVMSTAGQDLISGSLNATTFTEHMKSEYLRLRELAAAA